MCRQGIMAGGTHSLGTLSTHMREYPHRPILTNLVSCRWKSYAVVVGVMLCYGVSTGSRCHGIINHWSLRCRRNGMGVVKEMLCRE